MRKSIKSLLVALALAGGAAFGFLAEDAAAAGCPPICCEGTNQCYPCRAVGDACVCPDILCREP